MEGVMLSKVLLALGVFWSIFFWTAVIAAIGLIALLAP
jgi:hypothetical protein